MNSEHRLLLSEIEKASKSINPIFLNTPQYRSTSLSRFLNAEVYLKVETQTPVGSFKGRGCDWFISQNKNSEKIICASAGNFGLAMAYCCEKHNIDLTVYASINANSKKMERIRELGAKVVLHGNDFDDAKIEARRVALISESKFVEDSLDIETLEGAGSIGLELLNLEVILDYVLIALGNGALFNGIAKVFKEKSPDTKMIAVQSVGAPAMIESWRKKEIVAYEKVSTIADGIAVRAPIPQAVQDMEGLVDEGLLVKEESIISAMKLIYQHEKIMVEPSAAVGLAAMLENRDMFTGKKVGLVICGGNLTEEQIEEWLN